MCYYYFMNHKSSLTEEKAEVGLRLEKYDDIFSDFDVRPYSARALSVDFLEEIKLNQKLK